MGQGGWLGGVFSRQAWEAAWSLQLLALSASSPRGRLTWIGCTRTSCKLHEAHDGVAAVRASQLRSGRRQRGTLLLSYSHSSVVPGMAAEGPLAWPTCRL